MWSMSWTMDYYYYYCYHLVATYYCYWNSRPTWARTIIYGRLNAISRWRTGVRHRSGRPLARPTGDRPP